MIVAMLLPTILWGIVFGLTLWGTWYSLKELRQPFRRRDEPPITVLKPFKGVESGMPENMESFFLLDYPEFELLFCVADDTDPAAEVIRALIKKYPHVSAKLHIGEVNVGANPKVNNMYRAYESARHDWILISDSNTRVDRNYLRRLAPHLRPEVGVVTAVVAGLNPETWAGRLEAVYLNTFFARWTHLASALGKPFVIGKSMCFKKSVAARFGGIKNLGQYIAEDNMLGQAMLRLGLKVEIMTEPIGQHIGIYGFEAFWRRHVRWGRIRKSQAPIAFLLEPFVGVIFSGVIGGLAFHYWLDFSFETFFIFHLVFWSSCDFLMIRRLESKITTRAVFAWLLRELLAFPLWLHMACGSTILWRGNRLKIMPGGLVKNPTE